MSRTPRFLIGAFLMVAMWLSMSGCVAGPQIGLQTANGYVPILSIFPARAGLTVHVTNNIQGVTMKVTHTIGPEHRTWGAVATGVTVDVSILYSVVVEAQYGSSVLIEAKFYDAETGRYRGIARQTFYVSQGVFQTQDWVISWYEAPT